MSKKKGHGRSAFALKKQGFYLGRNTKNNNSSNGTAGNENSQAKGISMKNSNVSHRTCEG